MYKKQQKRLEERGPVRIICYLEPIIFKVEPHYGKFVLSLFIHHIIMILLGELKNDFKQNKVKFYIRARKYSSKQLQEMERLSSLYVSF